MSFNILETLFKGVPGGRGSDNQANVHNQVDAVYQFLCRSARVVYHLTWNSEIFCQIPLSPSKAENYAVVGKTQAPGSNERGAERQLAISQNSLG